MNVYLITGFNGVGSIAMVQADDKTVATLKLQLLLHDSGMSVAITELINVYKIEDADSDVMIIDDGRR